jgi:hypothetical protein
METFQYLKESPDNPYRLGRHQVHDALTPDRDAFRLAGVAPLRSVSHERVCAPFDQNHCNPAVIQSLVADPSATALGNCTANAAFGLLMTAPFHKQGWSFGEDDCVRLYHEETLLDDRQIPGEWPSDDTGSTGPWSMLALEQRGLIKCWVHTRSLHTALRLLTAGPISIGVSWFQCMFEPDSNDTIHVDEQSGLAGGHQIEVAALDVDGQRVQLVNSWGPGWGADGRAWLSWTDMDLLLHLGGDVVQPVL